MYTNKALKNANPHKQVAVASHNLDPELLDLCPENRGVVDFALRFFPGLTFFGLIAVAFYLAYHDVHLFFAFATIFAFYNLWIVSKIALFGIGYLSEWSKSEKRNFHEEYLKHRRAMLTLGHNEHQLREWNEVIHYVVLPNYKENVSVLSAALDNLAQSKLARTNMIVCLAMEGREATAEAKASELMQLHYKHFLDIIATFHPQNIPGEIPGKSSNDRWAIHEINQDVERRALDPACVCITIADADSFVHPLYFESVTSQFCNDPQRDEKIWQGAMACYKNFFSVPAPTRLLAVTVTIHEFAALANKSDLHIPFSTYSASLNFINLVGYDGDVIPEDWHLFIKGFFATGGRARVVTVPFPNICYAVEGETYVESLKERYVQATRHHWGVAEIVYFLRLAFRAYFINQNESAKPDLLTAFKLFNKLFGPHFIAGCGVFFLAMPFIVLEFYQRLWADSPIALSSLSEWSLPFRLLSYITFIPILWIIITNFFVVKKALANEHDVRWWHMFKWMGEMLVVFPVANVILATIPVLYCSVKLFFTESFQYVTASKPECTTPRLARSASEVV